MPIPIIAAVVWAAGAAITAGGGVGVVLTVKNKKGKAEFQAKIDELQNQLLCYQKKIKELNETIFKLNKEKSDLVIQVADYYVQIKTMHEQQETFEAQLKTNDSRFKKIIAFLTFRLNDLNKENDELSEKIAELNFDMSTKQTEIIGFELKKEKIETQIISSMNELKLANVDIQVIEEELRQAV